MELKMDGLKTCKDTINECVTPVVKGNGRILDTALTTIDSLNDITPSVAHNYGFLPGYSGFVLFAREKENHVAGRGNIAIAVLHNSDSDRYAIQCYLPQEGKKKDDVTLTISNISINDLEQDCNATMRKFTELYS